MGVVLVVASIVDQGEPARDVVLLEIAAGKLGDEDRRARQRREVRVLHFAQQRRLERPRDRAGKLEVGTVAGASQPIEERIVLSDEIAVERGLVPEAVEPIAALPLGQGTSGEPPALPEPRRLELQRDVAAPCRCDPGGRVEARRIRVARLVLGGLPVANPEREQRGVVGAAREVGKPARAPARPRRHRLRVRRRLHIGHLGCQRRCPEHEEQQEALPAGHETLGHALPPRQRRERSGKAAGIYEGAGRKSIGRHGRTGGQLRRRGH